MRVAFLNRHFSPNSQAGKDLDRRETKSDRFPSISLDVTATLHGEAIGLQNDRVDQSFFESSRIQRLPVAFDDGYR